MSSAIARATRLPAALEEAISRLPALSTVNETAELFRTAPSSIRHGIATGRIRSLKVGKKRLIAKDEIARLLTEGAAR